jgi:hypothetical protein
MDSKLIDGISKISDAINSMDVDWKVHLDAEVCIDGCCITVTFDRPVDKVV